MKTVCVCGPFVRRGWSTCRQTVRAGPRASYLVECRAAIVHARSRQTSLRTVSYRYDDNRRTAPSETCTCYLGACANLDQSPLCPLYCTVCMYVCMCVCVRSSILADNDLSREKTEARRRCRGVRRPVRSRESCINVDPVGDQSDT